jgi:hypothetical protein
MIKLLLSFLLTIFSITFCYAQIKTKSNAISFEIGKNGLIYNLTFDHKVATKNLGYKVGVGSNFAKYLNAFALGGGVYYLYGKHNRFFELGADLQYLI